MNTEERTPGDLAWKLKEEGDDSGQFTSGMGWGEVDRFFCHLQAWFWQVGRGANAVDTFMIRPYHILRKVAGGERE